MEESQRLMLSNDYMQSAVWRRAIHIFQTVYLKVQILKDTLEFKTENQHLLADTTELIDRITTYTTIHIVPLCAREYRISFIHYEN